MVSEVVDFSQIFSSRTKVGQRTNEIDVTQWTILN